MKRIIVLLVGLFAITSAQGQSKKDVLLTVDKSPVTAKEFKRVYTKNLELVQDASQKTVEGYLDLFIDYKLKVAEAYAQNLHLEEAYVKEFGRYEDQLARTYIYEDKVNEAMAEEAYRHGLEEINANHILIQSAFNDLPKDTLAAYEKIASIREKALAGEDFVTLAKTYSEEPGAKERGGALGYFSAFDMVYPFEKMAYATQEGEISEIVRTGFGYHIIKINERRPRTPDVSVSHIMITDGKGTRTFDPKERIQEIYALLQQGEKFEDLAKQYSDDKNSAINGGRLRRFGPRDIRSEKFVNVAYSLEKPGDVAEPFQSEFGWHIMRLEEKHGIPTFEEEKPELDRKVKKGARSKVVKATINNNIKEKYGFTREASYNPFFTGFVSDSLTTQSWKYDNPITGTANKTLFTIGSKSLTYDDFARFIEKNQSPRFKGQNLAQTVSNMYEEFEVQAVRDYFKSQLEKENEAYAGVVSEYRDGLLIFEVMTRNVWNKARTDSTGLQNYFASQQDQYQWKQRVDAVVVSATSAEVADQAALMLRNGATVDRIKKELNTDGNIAVIITEGIFEIDQKEVPNNFDVQAGVSKVYPQNDAFVVLKVNEVIPAGPKQLDDVRGKVLSNYQNKVESDWIESLRKKYKVKVNKKVLKRLKKEMDS